MNPAGSGSGISALLEGLGITDATTQDTATSAVSAEITRCAVVAKVTGIRWGRMTIETDPASAAALLWHKDRLEEIAREASHGQVTSVRIRITATGERA
jgi:hypothetical protein